MIQKVEPPQIQYPQITKIQIEPYKNPYLTKLYVKILPNYYKINRLTFFNPILNCHNIQIVQSLPLWKNQHFRFCLLWEQNVRNIFSRSQIGVFTEYRNQNDWQIQNKNLVGSSSFVTKTKISKTQQLYGNLYTLSAQYSSFLQSNGQIYHTLATRLSINKVLALSLTKRINQSSQLQLLYQKSLKHDLYFRLKYSTQLSKIEQGDLSLGVGFYHNPKLSSWINFQLQPKKIIPNLQLQFQYKYMNTSNSIIGAIQYQNQKSVLYLGYKSLTFNISLPICGTSSILPMIAGVGLFLYAYLTKIYKKIVKKPPPKKQQYKIKQQIKFISEKANQIYKKQQQINGLLIQQVYIAQKHLLNQFLGQQNKAIKALQNQNYKQNIFDCTISFRLYVQKSVLNLPQGNKLSMIGLNYKQQQNKQISIYIRYIKNGHQHEKRYQVHQQIKL